MPEIFFEEKSLKEFQKLPKKLKDRIIEKLKILEKGFPYTLDIKKLRGFENHYRLRVGKFRVLFYFEGANMIVYRIGKRGKVYE
ncbi:MAG: type II toxin-antitoxin system RelE/ParE family toxin [Candidatus Aenigmarchaeota archaeon]|nr:type II toxin-antitoxin system RelE/ParE family toxin [Candidatus Aenigmarchaeota archaeon]